jgi:outer membrane protein OmpA-like peptidoglycan-associated protein
MPGRVYAALATAAATTLTAAACATAAPSQELMQARTLYQRASQGTTAEQNPDGLRQAKRALERAERAHERFPGTRHERDLAYIANRKIRTAVAHAHMERDQQRTELARERYARLMAEHAEQAASRRTELERQLTQTKTALAEVRARLEAQSDELSERARELQEQEQQLIARQAELREAQRARRRAEERAEEAMEKLQALAQVRQEQDRLIITLSGSVLFQSERARILPSARNRLEEVAKALRSQNGRQLITVVGHTDSRGPASYNRELSQRRADAVRTFLVDQGLDPQQLVAVGRGESEPVATNRSPEGRAHNRRVEIVVEEAGERGDDGSESAGE